MKLSVAVIGCGKSACENHIPAYLNSPATQLVAVADPDSETCDSAAQRFGVKSVYDDYEVMLRKRRPDLVSVCAPPSERKSAVLSALSRGCHVLCDMPMAMNAEEGKTMLEAARDAERTLVVAAPRRFEVQAKTIRETVENGDLGQVSFSRAWRREEAIPADDLWQIKAESGGGALSISGQEMLDLALWLTADEPISVSGGLFHRFADNPDVRKTWFGSRRELDAEDLVIALVRCRKSMLALEVDWLASAGDSGVLVVGSKGRSRTSPFKMEVASKGEFVDMTPTFFPETSTWSEQVRAFIEAALGHDKPFPTAEETLRVQRVADAIRESSVTGREIRLSDA